eukprot:COSAG02_NODE_7407_length_3031_cov_1.984311_2_plen_148_part_00
MCLHITITLGETESEREAASAYLCCITWFIRWWGVPIVVYGRYGLDPQLAPKIMDPSGKFFDSGPGNYRWFTVHGWTRTYCCFPVFLGVDLMQNYVLRGTPGRAAAMIGGWKAIGHPRGMQIWAGEIAAAWHSGEPGVTNRFISSFW